MFCKVKDSKILLSFIMSKKSLMEQPFSGLPFLVLKMSLPYLSGGRRSVVVQENFIG